ncbi:putative integral membrane protein [Cryptosporidium felis]|nr:putative integral membrane protein [Cryptosporidium felis]
MKFKKLFLVILCLFLPASTSLTFAKTLEENDPSESTPNKGDENSMLTGSCLFAYSRFVNDFRRVSRNSILWPKLNRDEKKAKIKHNFSEKYVMLSSFMAIKKILQLQMDNSVNNDYIDSISLIKANILLLEKRLESELDNLPDRDKVKLLEARKRILANKYIINGFPHSSKEFNINNCNTRRLLKIFIRFFIYPAYLDLYNYGNIVLSRVEKKFKSKVISINKDINTLKQLFINLFESVSFFKIPGLKPVFLLN